MATSFLGADTLNETIAKIWESEIEKKSENLYKLRVEELLPLVGWTKIQ